VMTVEYAHFKVLNFVTSAKLPLPHDMAFAHWDGCPLGTMILLPYQTGLCFMTPC
jgi:hypothetical protein